MTEQPAAPYLDAVIGYGTRGPGRFHVPGHKGGPGADPGLPEGVRRPLLEDARAQPVLDVLPAPSLDDHALDALELEQPGQQQSRRTGSDDGDLSAHRRSPQFGSVAQESRASCRPL